MLSIWSANTRIILWQGVFAVGKVFSAGCQKSDKRQGVRFFLPKERVVNDLFNLKGMKNGHPSPPSIFKRIQPIDMELSMCNKCPVHLQFSIVTWHLIGFHDNHSNIMTLLVAAILDFQIFKCFHIQI